LREIGIAEYDEFEIIAATEARCDKDGLYFGAEAKISHVVQKE
jgi:hypothetical protein